MSLADKIKKHIRFSGPISVMDYMSYALYHPEYGYYKSKDGIGEKNDFITAPEVSSLFSEIIAFYFLNFWQKNSFSSPVHFIELGGGRGTALEIFLKSFSQKNELINSIQLHLVETNDIFKKKQQKIAKKFDKEIVFHKNTDSLPKETSFIFANEYFDALPIRQFIYKNSEWHEILIMDKKDTDHFDFTYSVTPHASLLKHQETLNQADEGDIYEFSPYRNTQFEDLCETIKSHGGLFLTIDYGFDILSFENTLHAIYKHEKAPLLQNPGLNDLSSYVNFYDFKSIAEKLNLKQFGPIEQGKWLKSLGIKERAKQLSHHLNEKDKKLIDKSIHRLTSPDEMGQIFKIFAVMQQQSNL